MRRTRKLGWALVGVLCLLLSPIAVPAENPAGFTQIAESEDPAEQSSSVPGPPRGIRSYGTGAARSDILPRAINVGAGQAQTASSAAGGTSFKISGASMVGDAVAFALSRNGETAVYIADQDEPGRFELYSTPVDGSEQPTKISAGLPFGPGDQGVELFQITPDNANVIFLADPNFGNGVDELFSVPIDGSASPTQLSAASQAPITGAGVFPNAALAAYFGVTPGGSVELFKAPINVPAASTQLSDAGTGNSLGNVVAAGFSPDSARAIYAADGEVDGVFQWYSVPSGASGPGQDAQLSDALGFVSIAAITPDNNTVVYSADQNVLGVSELFSVPIGGGSFTQLNPSMAGAGVTSIRVGPDSQRVAYLADQDTAGVTEVYSALVGVAGSGSRLNSPLSGTQSARSVLIGPEGATAVYEADENAAGTVELMAVPLDGSAAPSTLHGFSPPDNAGLFAVLGTPIVGPRAVYPVIGTEVNVFSVRIDGTETFVQVNDPLAAGDSIFNAFVPFAATRLMAYGTGTVADGITARVFSAPLRSDLAAEQVNTTAAPTAVGVVSYEVSSSEDFAVYMQDQSTTGTVELYSRALDSDGDSVVNAADNCKFVSNVSQNDLVFAQTVLASSETTFVWSDPTDVRFVRGPLSEVSVLTTDDEGPLIEASSYTHTAQPTEGAGFYYLFALDCPGGSYQTVLGAEPLRDVLLLP